VQAALARGAHRGGFPNLWFFGFMGPKDIPERMTAVASGFVPVHHSSAVPVRSDVDPGAELDEYERIYSSRGMRAGFEYTAPPAQRRAHAR
jgi:hypothetical protein